MVSPNLGATPSLGFPAKLVTFSYATKITNTKQEREETNMRRDLITRTISGTEVIAMVADSTSNTIEEKTITLNKVVEDMEKAKKAVTKELKDTNYVLVSIKSFTKIDKLFGITVADFMAHAIELDPATRNELKADTDNE